MSNPVISIIIPARDEEKYLPACLASIEASRRQLNLPIEIIVVLNRCQDRTAEIAQAQGCRLLKNDSKNLSAIRNTGVAAAIADFVITIDADSQMSLQLLPEVYSQLQDPNCVGGGVLIYPERYSLGILLTCFCLLPLVLLEGLAGGVFFFRKSDFHIIGGFNENYTSAEDIDFARRLKQHGKSKNQHFKLLLKSWIITSCRKFDRLGDWYFLKRPGLFLRLLRSQDKSAADKIWYDFPR